MRLVVVVVFEIMHALDVLFVPSKADCRLLLSACVLADGCAVFVDPGPPCPPPPPPPVAVVDALIYQMR